jgi:hypothetical protein
VTIVDWEAANQQACAGLLDAVVGFGKFAQLSIWTVSLSTLEKRLLRQRGFDLADDKDDLSEDVYVPDVLVRPTNPETLHGEWLVGGRDLKGLENWRIRAIDSDGM